MLERANKNKENAKAENVSFVDSQITAINLPDSVANCIISNCVVNLVPESEKQLVFNEMFRLLKPGGRVAISDILAKKPLPAEILNSVALYVGCIAGASQVQDYEKYLRKAGFDGMFQGGSWMTLDPLMAMYMCSRFIQKSLSSTPNPT